MTPVPSLRASSHRYPGPWSAEAWGKVSASILDTRKIPNVSREVQEREREVSAMMRGVRVDFDEDETVGTVRRCACVPVCACGRCEGDNVGGHAASFLSHPYA